MCVLTGHALSYVFQKPFVLDDRVIVVVFVISELYIILI